MKEIITDSKGNTRIKVTTEDYVKIYTPKEWQEKEEKERKEKENSIDSEELEDKTVSELKELCKERDLKVSGTKSELIERLAEN